VKTRCKILLAIGSLLAAVSLGVWLFIWGAESEADILGDEALQELQNRPLERQLEEVFDSSRVQDLKAKEPSFFARNENGEESIRIVKDTLVWKGLRLDFTSSNNELKRGDVTIILSRPSQAKVVLDSGGKTYRTPTLVPIDKGEYLLTTTFRKASIPEEKLGQLIEIPFKLKYLILTNLIWPGLALILAGLFLHKKDSDAAPSPSKQPEESGERKKSSSLDTVVNVAPPAPPTGLYEHDPSTPEELIYGRFVRGEFLGKGNMGQVYKCTSCLLGDKNTYALKVLLPEWSKAEDFRGRFKREADICQKLAHPNLVRAYEHGEKEDRLWMVMDYVDGLELDQWLEKNKPTEKTLLKMAEDLCDGLEYAHELGVIHRDLKPGNILIKNSNGRPVIADFGLARGKHYETITKTNTTLGTPTYMPPEQITGGKGSAQGDLYSLGCILYEALSGKPPFDESDVMKLLTLKLTEDAPTPLEASVASPELRDIVTKLLFKTPDERYQSAGEVKQAIASLN
jgi:predicted Ser/Thr protein kinase